MNINIREYMAADAKSASEIWNQVVDDGVAFPQEEVLTPESGDAFFKEQTYTGIAENSESGEVVGLYILHPNNVGRCGHICNASYAVGRCSDSDSYVFPEGPVDYVMSALVASFGVIGYLVSVVAAGA